MLFRISESQGLYDTRTQEAVDVWFTVGAVDVLDVWGPFLSTFLVDKVYAYLYVYTYVQ